MKRDEDNEPEASGESQESVTPETTPQESESPEAVSSESAVGEPGDDVAGDVESAGDPEANDEIAPDSELAEALREKDQFRALAQRAQADFVNFRTRVEEEKVDVRRRTVRSVLMKALEVVDGIDAALEPDAIAGVDEKFVHGVEAISRNFESFLAGENVERFESVGEKFDPRLHEALMRTETTEHSPDTVIRVMRVGYMMGDDVLRPALVEVAAPEAASEPEEN